ncbi:hypothetical protein, partial [Silvimonas amylolytica]
MRTRIQLALPALSGMVLALSSAQAWSDSDSDLAQKLSNPVAALISVPLQFNYDDDIGPSRDGDKYLLN